MHIYIMEEVKDLLIPGVVLSHFKCVPWVQVWDILWFVSTYPIGRPTGQPFKAQERYV
jgi:hypothetical protein